MSRLENCCDCPHLVGLISLGCPIYGCGKTPKKIVVPQETERRRGQIVTRFTRVPIEFCPRPDDEVHKRPADATRRTRTG